MITPNDIRNPLRASGYNHVVERGDGARSPFVANVYGGALDKSGRAWQGPRRRTALEAAQDYCDYINAQKFLTIEDLRNPKRKSGFNHVGNMAVTRPGRPKPFFAVIRDRGSLNWTGPYRATAEEAAQDYCDYVNGQRGATPATLASHGHTRTRKAKIEYTPEERAAQKLLREAAAKRKADKGNFVYLVGEDSDPSWVKIGEAYDPEDRYIGGQTFNPRTLVLLGYQKAEQPRGADKVLHRKFAQHHHRAEWFRPADEILSHFNITKSEFLRRCGGTTKEVKTV